MTSLRLRRFAGGLCLSLLLAGCGAQRELEQRTRRHFEVPGDQPVNIETIHSAVLKWVPRGTSANDVYAYLMRWGIGQDSLSAYYPLNEQNNLICYVSYNIASFDLVKNSFDIIFLMDRVQRVQDIHVQERRTGL